MKKFTAKTVVVIAIGAALYGVGGLLSIPVFANTTGRRRAAIRIPVSFHTPLERLWNSISVPKEVSGIIRREPSVSASPLRYRKAPGLRLATFR